MKIIINYDFFKKICDVNEPLGPVKIYRNDRKIIPLCMGLNSYLCMYSIPAYMCQSLLNAGGVIMIMWFLQCCLGYDVYAKQASDDLKKLVSQLKKLHVNTDYDLLLQSELYKKKYNIKLNENKIPCFLEQKYVLVPTYNYNGDIKETSILQEHVVGFKEYVLSIGSPKPVFKFAYSK